MPTRNQLAETFLTNQFFTTNNMEAFVNRKRIYTIISIIIWLFIWVITAGLINNQIFLPGPKDVITALIKMASTSEFYLTLFTSLKGIAIGFSIGLVGGIILSSLAYICNFLEVFFGTFMKVIKSVPVASFIILTLFWVSSNHLPILISALIVLPIIYNSLLVALKGTDKKLLEFAGVYRLSPFKKIRYIYIPSALTPLISGCQVAIGYAWKSGVAAEIIGLIRGTIGNELYQTKLYLATDELFAWTLSIILMSFLCEKIIVFLLSLIKPHRFATFRRKSND